MSGLGLRRCMHGSSHTVRPRPLMVLRNTSFKILPVKTIPGLLSRRSYTFLLVLYFWLVPRRNSIGKYTRSAYNACSSVLTKGPQQSDVANSFCKGNDERSFSCLLHINVPLFARSVMRPCNGGRSEFVIP